MQHKIEKSEELITKYVNESDPWYLIEMEAPPDEYRLQIRRIMDYIDSVTPTKSELSKKLFEIFQTKEHELDSKRIDNLVRNLMNIKQ